MSDHLCYHVRGFTGERVLIPGCLGAAIYGLSACTCDRRRHQRQLLARVEELEQQVAALLAQPTLGGRTGALLCPGTNSKPKSTEP